MALLLFGIDATNISWYKNRENPKHKTHIKTENNLIRNFEKDKLFQRLIRMGVPYALAKKQIYK